MKIFLYVVALILIAFGAAISVMSWLAPGDVLVGVTPALGASLLVGGLLLLGLGVIVAGLQELNASILHLLYLVSEQQNAFAGSGEAVDGMEEAAPPYEEPFTSAVPPAAAEPSNGSSVSSQAPVTGEAPSPGHMAAAAAIAAMAAREPAGEAMTKEPPAETPERSEGERPAARPETPAPAKESVPTAKLQSATGAGGKQEQSSAQPAITEGKGPEPVAEKPAMVKEGQKRDAGPSSAVVKPEAEERKVSRKESEAFGEQKTPASRVREVEKGRKEPAGGRPGEKIAEGQGKSPKEEPIAEPVAEEKEAPVPAAERKEPEVAEGKPAVKQEGAGDFGRNTAVERLTGAAAAVARKTPDKGKGQSAAEKIAARLEALKKESVFAEKKTGIGTVPSEEPPLEKVLKNVSESVGETGTAGESKESAGEELLYVVEQRVIRGRQARILSDGTIEAEMDEGWLRFENREHLDEYLDALEAEK